LVRWALTHHVGRTALGIIPYMCMMRRFATIALLLCALVSMSAAETRVKRLDGSSITPAEIDGMVERLMGAAQVTGLGIAILNNRRVAYLKTYGQRDTDRNLPLTPDSVMTSASYSKSTFAFMVMQLVEEGALNLDTPIQEYLSRPLPEYPAYTDLAADERHRRITARMLLSHTTGFPNLRILNEGRLDINSEPGSRYAYSGEGIRLLQLVVEEVTGRSVNDLMRERIFGPFRMTRTSMVWEPSFESDYANGYDERGRSLGPQRRTRADAAGSMQTSLADFSRFIEGVMQRKGLKRNTRTLMFSPQVAIHSRRQFPTLSTESTDRNRSIRLSYGLGWGLFWSPFGKAFFKEGHDDGFQHYTVMFDALGTGIVIMTNSSNGEGIFQELLEQLIKNTYTPIEWEGYVPYSQRPPLPPLPARPRAVDIDPKLLDAYAGRYRLQGQPLWTVARDGNRLTVVEEGDTELIVLAAESDRTFYAKATDADVTFERDEQGRVTGLVVRVKGLVLSAMRID
jgi:CubicO group peptidase (beta-lactamase class C family)